MNSGSFLINLLKAACLLSLWTSSAIAERINNVPALGSLTTQKAQYISTADSLDAPHIIGISPESYEWWWFDAESPDLDSSIVIVFFTANPTAFPLVAGIPSVTSIVVNAKLSNGSTIISEAASNGATISSGGEYGNGAFGEWNGLGNFSVAPDLSSATIRIDLWGLPTPIRGSITYNSVSITNSKQASLLDMSQIAPPHYPCTTNLNPGNNLSIVPHIGWSNAIPAAMTKGEFEILGGEKFTVNGFGYHDKNWGDKPFLSAISSWYWGHAHFGPWSIVFFNGTTADGIPFADAYVSKDGKVLISSCEAGSAIADPTLDVLGNLQSVEVTIPIPNDCPLKVVLKATSTNIEYPGVYSRYLISASGGQEERKQFEGGSGTLEHFTA